MTVARRQGDVVHAKGPYLNDVTAWNEGTLSESAVVKEELESLGMPSPLEELMTQWGDLEDIINTMRTPSQSIDELISALEAIDFSSMLETPEGAWDHLSGDNEDNCNQRGRSRASSTFDEDDAAPFSVAFTMEDIQSSWGEEVLASNLLHIPKRERAMARTIVLNLLRMFVPRFDSSYKMLSESHLMQLIQCANRILGAFLP
ncbi:hypothetical protein DYB25_011140 [Aphanomyces astaci]|uniref:Uncharacterized protein n=1 Tax=Aphanomyces astaci TaxID=112090 RepID=A0A397BX42_APHAT|nr:hypothetical protein DYB25_011140 [Aphanomyces astaci]RHY75419.1 hypothetical protein DYB30_012035 [Aphanomyces astaci]